jgi:hypothetical protein
MKPGIHRIDLVDRSAIDAPIHHLGPLVAVDVVADRTMPLSAVLSWGLSVCATWLV